MILVTAGATNKSSALILVAAGATKPFANGTFFNLGQKKFSTLVMEASRLLFMSNDIRIIEHEGQTYIVSSMDFSTEDTIVHARKLVRCKYDKRTLNVTSATMTRESVRIVNPKAKPQTVKFTKEIALKVMIKPTPSKGRRTVETGEDFRNGLADALGKADAFTSRLVAKALGGRQEFELRCHALALDLGFDYETASDEDRAAIEALAKEEC